MGGIPDELLREMLWCPGGALGRLSHHLMMELWTELAG